MVERHTTPLLETLALEHPYAVMNHLSEGSEVKKSLGLTYTIDDSGIHEKLGTFPQGSIPYGPIHRALNGTTADVLQLFEGSSNIPFSKAYDRGIGECLEKAILIQLCAQKKERSYLINGVLEQEGETGAGHHAFNIVVRKEKPFLVDAQNPLAKDKTGKITHPYIAPIEGINQEYGELIVPEVWKQGRTYSIF